MREALRTLLFGAAAAVALGQTPARTLTPCQPAGVAPPVACGFVAAPADHHAPDGPIIRLRVMLLQATGPDRAPDPLLYLAGGPGAAAGDAAVPLSERFASLRRRRDIVLIDQRGTGQSVPYNCSLTTAEGRPAALTSSLLSPQLVDICAKGPGAAAGAAPGMDARLFTTAQAADDIATVAAALGYEQVNLYGVSYGTRLGLVFLQRHPQRVRTLSLQGVVLPSAPIPVTGTWGTQQALDRLVQDCEQDAVCGASYPRFRAQLGAIFGQKGQANTVLAGAITAALYSTAASSQLPAAVAEAAAGRYGRLLGLSASGGSGAAAAGMTNGLYLSILCAEDVPFITAQELDRLAQQTSAGDATVRALMRTCARWPQGAVAAADRELPRAARPVLLLSGEMDPITPADQAQIAADALPESRHVILRGTGHSGAANACAAGMVSEMVERGAAGSVDARCASRSGRPRFAAPMPERLR